MVFVVFALFIVVLVQSAVSAYIFDTSDLRITSLQWLIPIVGLLISFLLRRKYGYVSGCWYCFNVGCHVSYSDTGLGVDFVDRCGQPILLGSS